jgi:hypothetical protein
VKKRRECGECRACCITPGFEAAPGEAPFSKPPNTPCPHLVQIGCGIYETRPPVCRRFQCAWLAAPNLPAEMRPDRCGVLFCTNDNPLRPGTFAVFAYELRERALRGRLARWLVDQVRSESTVILVRADGQVSVLTADPQVETALEGNGTETGGIP